MQREATINAEASESSAERQKIKQTPWDAAKGIVLHHDNARPDTAGQTRNFLDSFGREVLDHRLYSPDLAPRNHLFLHLKQHLSGNRYNDDDDQKRQGILGYRSWRQVFIKRSLCN